MYERYVNAGPRLAPGDRDEAGPGQKRKIGIAVLGTAAFLGVTVLHWPLFAVVGVLIPLSFAAQWRLAR